MRHRLTLKFTAFNPGNQKTTHLVKTFEGKNKTVCDIRAVSYFANLQRVGFYIVLEERKDEEYE